ncbi:putative transporter [Anaerohalosphaera lusitana]|uniref:Putative transporter n=1 Tax=Anaerohalosphaera lusitana TaxID=1936003 RepID=A0A1U9NMX6_9BACT|nr:MFS transporter [Anaerohalosphaera lusitana]AQT69271.1 putative transporter [Anaerohalosphaera lusitana]
MSTVVVLASLFGLGMCFSLLGSISVKLMPRLEIDQGKFGTLVSIFMFSCLVASLVMGVAVDSVGYKPIALFGFLMTAGCIFYLANSKSYKLITIPCLLLGFGAMAMNVVGNTLAKHVLFGGQNEAAALNLGNVFFGLGLFVTPIVVSFLFQKTTYEKAVASLGVLIIVPAILVFSATFPDKSPGFAFEQAVQLLGNPAVLVSALVLFCYISLEASFCNWLPMFGKDVIKKDAPSMDATAADASAQRLLSLFAIGMMASRLAASFLASKVTIVKDNPAAFFIVGAALVSGILIVAMINTRKTRTAQVLATLAGIAFAPVFPTVVGVTFGKFSSDVHGSVLGIIFAIGLAGAVIAPKAIGNLSRGSSVQKSLKLLVPVCGVLLLLGLAITAVKNPASDSQGDDMADDVQVEQAIDDAEAELPAETE